MALATNGIDHQTFGTNASPLHLWSTMISVRVLVLFFCDELALFLWLIDGPTGLRCELIDCGLFVEVRKRSFAHHTHCTYNALNTRVYDVSNKSNRKMSTLEQLNYHPPTDDFWNENDAFCMQSNFIESSTNERDGLAAQIWECAIWCIEMRSQLKLDQIQWLKKFSELTNFEPERLSEPMITPAIYSFQARQENVHSQLVLRSLLSPVWLCLMIHLQNDWNSNTDYNLPCSWNPFDFRVS